MYILFFVLFVFFVTLAILFLSLFLIILSAYLNWFYLSFITILSFLYFLSWEGGRIEGFFLAYIY